MSDEKDKKNKPLSQFDQQVWDKYAKELTPVVPDDVVEEDFEALLEAHDKEPEADIPPKTKLIEPVKTALKKPMSDQPAQIDRRTSDKLRKGQIAIEARLDLHGMRQVEAHEALNQFMNNCIKKNLRCLLVITGKGKSRVSTDQIIEPEKGVLKQKLPEWLHDANFKKNILKVVPAHKKDGGSGAFYIYLKKNR